MKKYSLIICIMLSLSLMTSCTTKDKSSSDLDTSQTSVTTPTQTSEIKPISLKDFDIKDFGYTSDDGLDVSFLDSDLQKLFREASFVAFLLSHGGDGYFESLGEIECTSSFKIHSDNMYVENNEIVEKTHYSRSGINYLSFTVKISELFTVRGESEWIRDEYRYKDVNNELWYMAGARGSSLGFNRIEFELTSQTDDKIEFKGIAYFDDEFTPNQPNYTEEHNYVIVKTANGWRFDEFEVWNINNV